MKRWLVLAGALVIAGCGDDAGEEPGDAAARDAAPGDAATRDADPGDTGDAVRPGLPWTGWHGGDGDCIDVGEPLASPFCVGDYCLERPSLPLERPLAVDGSAANDIYRLFPDLVLWHRGCSGWAVVPDALPDEARCVSAAEQAECFDDVDSENCAPVCTLVVAGPSSVWLLSDGLWRFDGVAFRRWPDAPDGIFALQKVGGDLWVTSYTPIGSSAPPPAPYRLEDERFVRHAGGALEELVNAPRLHGIPGGDVWAGTDSDDIVLRWDGASWRTVDPPPPPSPGTGSFELAVFGDEDVWLSNGEDVKRWTANGWELVVERAHDRITTAAPGEVWISSNAWNGSADVWSGERFDGSAFHPVEYPATTFAQHAFGGSMWVSEGQGALARYADGGWQYELGTADDGSVFDLAGVGETLWMASVSLDATRFWRRGAAGFESVHEERGTYRLYVRAADDVWAYGERDGTARVLHWDGASWEPVSPSPPDVLIDLWSDGTTVLGLSPWRLRRYASPVWEVVFDLPETVTVSGMYAAALDDVWVIGIRTTDSDIVNFIGHWDGNELREIAAPPRAEAVRSIAGTGPDDVWIGLNSGPMRWEGGDWVQMAPEVPEEFDRLLPAGEGNLLLCYYGRVQLWTGSDVEDVAIEPGGCPGYAASPTDFWATAVLAPDRANHHYYRGVWHAQLH